MVTATIKLRKECQRQHASSKERRLKGARHV